MKVDGVVQGGSTVPRRRRPNVVLALVAIVMVATVAALLLVWSNPLARSGVGAEGAGPDAGPAVIHDDAWNMPSNASPDVVRDGSGNLHAST